MPNDVNLKLILTPDIKNLDQVTKKLETAVQASGDKNIGQQFDAIKQKVLGIQQVFETQEWGKETFKALGKDVQKVFGDIQTLAIRLGNLDMTEGVKEYQKQLLASEERIRALSKAVSKTKKGLVLGKEDKFVFSDNEKNRRVKEAGLTREVKVRGKSAGPIASYEGAVKYQEALKEEGKTNTDIYKKVTALIDEIYKDEVERQSTLEKQNQQLSVEEKNYDSILKKIKEINEESSKGKGSSTSVQQASTEIFTEASTGKASTITSISKGIEAQDAKEETNNVSNAINDLGESTKRTDGVFGKAVKNLTSYTLILGYWWK